MYELELAYMVVAHAQQAGASGSVARGLADSACMLLHMGPALALQLGYWASIRTHPTIWYAAHFFPPHRRTRENTCWSCSALRRWRTPTCAATPLTCT